MTGSAQPLDGTPRIVVVGPCASGKTALANRLRELGHHVRVCGQEHSAIRNLWRTMEPDVLIALALDLETLRARRSPTWPAHLYAVQQARLHDAYVSADLVIDTSATPLETMVNRVLDLIANDSANWA